MVGRRHYLAILAFLFAFPVTSFAGEWKAGTAKAKITPDQYMAMAGYGSRVHPATGFLNDLYAKVLVLEDAGGTRGAIITLDLVGISPDIVGPLVQLLERKYALPRAAIMICCSHTHSGPVVGHNLRTLHYDQLDSSQQNLVDEYAEELTTKIVTLVGQAIDALAVSDLSYGQGHATFAANRRNNPENEVPKRRAAGNLVGPFDHDVPVLRVVDESGTLKAVLFGYACHATVLSDYDWSSDYPGFAQEKLEEDNPGCVALFFAGCGADQNPLPRRKVELARDYGEQLATAVETVLTRPLESITPELLLAYETIPLELSQIPTKEEIAKDVESKDKYVAARANYYRKELDAGRELSATYDYPVQAWRLGSDLKLIALGGEVVVDYALRLKQEHGADSTWVAGYSNDVMAYIPSRRVLAEGGYEGGGAMVYYSLPSPWMPSVEATIIDAVRQTIPNP